MRLLLAKNKFNYLFLAAIATVIGANILGYLGAYALTNYREKEEIALGYPRPQNKQTPQDFDLPYRRDRITIDHNQWIETWSIATSNATAKGTVVLFHGKGGSKSSLLPAAKVFRSLGYDTILVDFRGAGGSSGNITTVGVAESQDVVTVIESLKISQSDKPLILYGISMGSAAILRAIARQDIQPDGIILELPFSSLLSAVKNRLKRSKIPAFPLGELMVFWGGMQNGFNGFAHNPIDYAQEVNCPTLILQGELDYTVDAAEIEELYDNLGVTKKLVNFENGGHQVLVTVDPLLWQNSVFNFLDNLP